MGVVLLGYRGSGKSAVGRGLADKLGVPLIDTDAMVTAAAGATIAEIFAKQGEATFRTFESRALAEALRQGDAVIATGGGIVLATGNRAALEAYPHPRVYLRCEAAELLRRIEADAGTAATRPNLTVVGGLAEVRLLLAAREPFYRQLMTAELDVTKLSVDEVVAALMRII